MSFESAHIHSFFVVAEGIFERFVLLDISLDDFVIELTSIGYQLDGKLMIVLVNDFLSPY